MTNGNAKILIVDDEQVIIDSLEKICSLEGYDTISALDAETGNDLVNQNNFDLIITDIMLPEMDGFEFLKLLHQNKIATPVIMTTGYSTVENAVKSLAEGAIDYIPKPFSVDEILAAIHRGLRLIEIKDDILHNDTSSIVYVECPSKYYRLGLCSWAFLNDNGTALIGATDLFLNMVDNIEALELKETNEGIFQGTSCARFNTKDTLSHDLLSPLSGKIIEVNSEAGKGHDLVLKDPYFKGWLYKVVPSDIEYEISNLTSCCSKEL